MRMGFVRKISGMLLLAPLLFVSPSSAADVRSGFVSALSPAWQWVAGKREGFFKTVFAFRYVDTPDSSREKEIQIARLATENQRLRDKLEEVKQWMISEEYIERQISFLNELRESSDEDLSYIKRRIHSLVNRIEFDLHAVPARVIYRDPSFWNQFVWINVGEEDNSQIGYPVIQKNSPVVVGNHLVGVVERVERGKSLVRLVTDRQFAVGVRACRGKEQSSLLGDQLERIFEESAYAARFKKVAETEKLLGNVYLAKGTLEGGLSSRWRTSGKGLIGVGFNYDYEDEEGPPRDLRTGAPFKGSWNYKEGLALIQEGDLLVTTGYDGVFPEGLYVGTVDVVAPLVEGAVAYEIKALPSYPDMEGLETLLVIPPVARVK